MKILLTGNKGFIGSNIQKAYEQQGHEVIAIEANEVNSLLSDPDALSAIIFGVDLVNHQGAIADTTLQDYNEMLTCNYEFTRRLIDLCKEYEKPMIFASSAAIYGVDGTPTNIYGWSKKLADEYGRAHYPLGFTALRYFNVYGPGEEHKGNMASVVFQASQVDKFTLFPKKPSRDFVYVKDIVSANLHATNSPGGAYEVGSGDSRTFEDVLDNFGVNYDYHHEDKIPSWYQYYTKSNPDNWLPGWKPEYSLEKGVKDYKEYLYGVSVG